MMVHLSVVEPGAPPPTSIPLAQSQLRRVLRMRGVSLES